MTQEEKELLIKDLSARLQYNVQVLADINKTFEGGVISTLKVINLKKDWVELQSVLTPFKFDEIKPYLRPMSSMTEEEAKELLFIRLASKYGESCAYIKNFIKLNEVSFQKKSPYKGSIAVWFSFKNKIYDTPQIKEYSKCEYLGQINDITLAEINWLNAHHFDYRGLIEKGLAIKVTEENNPYV